MSEAKILADQVTLLLTAIAAKDQRIAELEAMFSTVTDVLEYGPKTASLSLTFRNEADRAKVVTFIRAAKAALDGGPT